jgi:hypothetical protein
MELLEQKRAKKITIYSNDYGFVMTPSLPFSTHEQKRYLMWFKGSKTFDTLLGQSSFTDDNLLSFFYLIATENVDKKLFYESPLNDEKDFALLKRDLQKSRAGDVVALILDEETFLKMVEDALDTIIKTEKLTDEEAEEILEIATEDLKGSMRDVIRSIDLKVQKDVVIPLLRKAKNIEDLFKILRSAGFENSILDMVHAEVYDLLLYILKAIRRKS